MAAKAGMQNEKEQGLFKKNFFICLLERCGKLPKIFEQPQEKLSILYIYSILYERIACSDRFFV